MLIVYPFIKLEEQPSCAYKIIIDSSQFLLLFMIQPKGLSIEWKRFNFLIYKIVVRICICVRKFRADKNALLGQEVNKPL